MNVMNTQFYLIHICDYTEVCKNIYDSNDNM